MKRKLGRFAFVVILLSLLVPAMGHAGALPAAAPAAGPDLYMKDTPADIGLEPNPDAGPMWVSEDIWVRTNPDPGYQPYPFAEASPPWAPLPHENPEYRDSAYSAPNYVYVRVRNRGTAPSTGTERLRLYWAKASSSLAWPTQWVDYLPGGPGSTLYGAEVTKPRKNAATATPAERAAYIAALQKIGSLPGLAYPDGVSYWGKQGTIHGLSSVLTSGHGTPAFLPWHREFINRYELLLQKADPTVKLLYWDWTTDPQPSAGFNFFTSSFMGASGRSTGGVSLAAPFYPPWTTPPLPAVTRLLRTGPPPAEPDSSVLSETSYGPLRTRIESVPNHNSSHCYLGQNSSIDICFPPTAARDPLFFLLHTNVDRLWAQWQRNLSNPANLARLDPATAYGTTAGDANITSNMVPWNGADGLRPWTAADGFIVNKTALSPSVITPPIYDTAPLVVPVLQPGQAVVIQIPWYPPNPADFASFGADRGHFCLLARIETAGAPGFGMTFPEGSDIVANTRNNNDIAWKNVTVVDNFPGALGIRSLIVRNLFDKDVLTSFRLLSRGGFAGTFLDMGRIFVDLGPELFARWRAGGSVGKGVEAGAENRIQIFTADAEIQNIALKPGEMFPVDVRFELGPNYQPSIGMEQALDFIQMGTPTDPNAVVGGNRFNIDFSKLVPVEQGGDWWYLDDGSAPGADWLLPGYDDSKWKLGRADLGFGNNPTTTVDGGPTGQRHIATYFRRTFQVDDPKFFRDLHMRLRRNDGAVVYLNGNEVYRANMPGGAVTPKTLATTDVGGLERDVYFPVNLEPGLLQPGTNVIAAEVHLASPASADLNFDLELIGNAADLRLPPAAAFTAPTEAELFQAGEAIPIQVEALDPDGKIASVLFFGDGKLLGEDTDPPYTFQWTGAALGAHHIRAVAVDNDRLETPVDRTVTVVANRPPSVDIALPDGKAMFDVGEPIRVSAEASDPGGAVARVEFHVMSMARFDAPDVLVGTAAAKPYEITFGNLPPGDYMLWAVAVDNGGATGQSRVLDIEVMATLWLPLILR
ncbi:MAG: tyrosinase family protein [Nitrososphaerales archaeon]